MMRIWDSVVRPLVDTVPVANLVEIGAEEGKGTRALLRYLRSRTAVLHCVDPFPAFDPQALASKFGDGFYFYRERSLNVIPTLPEFDVALLDGDHNWYTVYHELQLIEQLHGHDADRFPLLILHDTSWPYGRRDLYYDPNAIPAQYRQPYRRAGMLPNRRALEPAGGLNVELCNAEHSGGARNGVMTGIEDYIKQSRLAFRKIDLPVYYGLTILVSEARLGRETALAAALASQQSVEGLFHLMAVGEQLRCSENVVLQGLRRQLTELERRLAALESDLGA